MKQHLMKAAAALEVTIALVAGCSSKDMGIDAGLVSPVLITDPILVPQGGGGYQSPRCPEFDDLFGS
jgi:hypothetical protein